MNIAVVIATCGEQSWSDLAFSRAYPFATTAGVVLMARYYPEARARIAIDHYPELTVSQARNAAAANADDEEWLCFLDADDELEPDYLAAMARAYLDPSFAGGTPPPLLVPAVRYFRDVENSYGDRGISYSRAAIPNRGRWPETNECVIGTLVRADLFRAVGGFRDRTNDGTELVSIEDYDLWLRCYDAGAQLVYVEGAVYRAYVNPAGGRNRDQSPYYAIWADHLARIEAVA